MIAGFLEWIEKDADLRRVHAYVRGKFANEASPDPGHDLAHFLRVALWTCRIGGASIDPREGAASALLHDIVPIPKDSPLRKQASRLCAEEAERVLPGLGFEPPAVARISEAIRCHSFSRGEKAVTPLAMALQDADRLEALGSIGIMRCLSTGARMGTAYFHGDDPWAASRALDDRAYSIDHFFTKLLRLPSTMTTEAGRLEAEHRAGIMRDFLLHLGEELGKPATHVNIQF
jgi:uncharacterized protein